MRLRSLAAVAIVPLAVTSLAACGSSKSADPLAAAKDYAKTAPTTIDQAARDALTSLKSVHVNATVTESGSASTDQPVTMDMSLDTNGNCDGSMTTEGYTFEILGVSSTYYFKTSAAFWSAHGAPSSVLSKVADKWVTGSSASGMASACDLASLTKEITSDPSSNDKPKVVGAAMVDGVAVVNLQVDNSDGKTNTISVAAAAPHNVIQMVSEDGKNKMTFSSINQPVVVTAPSDAVNTDTLK